ncbi:MAG: hypothetical protein MJH08_12610 [Hyphomicrobiales bacterium]|nr:hypothetical protein [Hyphomicrobiales bacterium]
MINTNNVAANLGLAYEQIERLGKEPIRNQCLDSADTELVLSDRDMWTTE